MVGSRTILNAILAACMLLMSFIGMIGAGTTAHASALVHTSYSKAVVIQTVLLAHRDQVAVLMKYTVLPGDTLSLIARVKCDGRTNDWTGIYEASRKIVGSNPNLIFPGQIITVKCTDPPAILHLGNNSSAPSGSARPKVNSGSYGHPYYCGDGDGDGWDVPCPTAPPVASKIQASSPAPAASSDGYSVGSSFQQCVINAESGGNAGIWNASGHWGLYQFSESTWIAAGGSASMFGNASSAYQTQIFDQAYALWGTSPWAPYDGC